MSEEDLRARVAELEAERDDLAGEVAGLQDDLANAEERLETMLLIGEDYGCEVNRWCNNAVVAMMSLTTISAVFSKEVEERTRVRLPEDEKQRILKEEHAAIRKLQMEHPQPGNAAHRSFWEERLRAREKGIDPGF